MMQSLIYPLEPATHQVVRGLKRVHRVNVLSSKPQSGGSR
jgi:hypothetical protein